MRARDRLPELHQRSGAAPQVGWRVERGEDTDTPPHPPHIAQLLQQVESIRGWVCEVAQGTAVARALLADPTFHTDRSLQERLDSVVTRSNAAGLKVCGALRQLEAAGGAPGAGGKIARMQAACGRRAYGEALAEQQELLAAARDDHLRLLRTHAHIVNADLTDEECARLLDAGAGGDNIALFVGNVRAETAAARLALREAEARRAELARVEGALADVHGLFAQLAALVAAQQGAIDTVAHFAAQATADVGGGQRHLLKGNVVRRKTQRKKYGLIICLASGAILVLMVLILT